MTPPKLPVIATVLENFRIFWRHRRTYVRLAWFPFVVWWLFYIFHPFLHSRSPYGNRHWEKEALIWLFDVSLSLLALFCVIPLITVWHRLIILGKPHEDSRIQYSFREAEWIYFRRIFVILVVLGLAVGLTWFASGYVGLLIADLTGYQNPFDSKILRTPLLIFTAAFALMPFAGYLLVLPAAAINRPLSFREVGRYWRGNLARLWAVYILAMVPETIGDWILIAGEHQSGKWLIGGAVDVYKLLSVVNAFVFFTLTVGVMSLAYKLLVEGRRPDTIAPPAPSPGAV